MMPSIEMPVKVMNDIVLGYNKIPGPRGLPLIGNGADFLQQELHELFLAYQRKYGNLVKFQILGQKGLLVSDPVIIEQIMIKSREQFYKRIPTFALKPIVGDSIFISNKPEWYFGRRNHPYTQAYSQPFFNHVVIDTQGAIRAALRDHVNGTPLVVPDLYPMVVRIVFDSFCRSVFGVVLGDKLYHDYLKIMEFGHTRLQTQLPTVNPRFWQHLKSWFDAITVFLHQTPDKIDANSVLGLLSREGTAYPEATLINELSTLITGGVHPVATAVCAAVYTAQAHPSESKPMYETVRKPRQEFHSVAALSALTDLDAHIKETLRLYSPVSVFLRAVQPDLVANLGGYAVPGNTEVFMSSWVMQRHPDYWSQPEDFIPGRFSQKPVPMTYFPFGIGERTCVGQPFANIVMSVFVYELFNQYSVVLKSMKPLKMTQSTGFVKPKSAMSAQINPL